MTDASAEAPAPVQKPGKLRKVLAILAMVVAAVGIVISLAAAGATGGQASGGTILSLLFLGAAGMLLLNATWAGWWMMALWLMVPLQGVFRALASGDSSPLPALILVLLFAAGLVAVRRDLPAPAPVKPLASVAILVVAFPLFVFTIEKLVVSSLKAEGVRDFTARRAMAGLILPSSFRDVAEHAKERQVREVALSRIADSAFVNRIKAAEAAKDAAVTARVTSIQAENDRVKAIASPLAGTWRFEITIAGERPLTFFGRTTLHPDGAIWSGDGSAPAGGAAGPATGYILQMMVHRAADSLPTRYSYYDGSGRNGTAAFMVTSAAGTEGAVPAALPLESNLFRGLSQLHPGGYPPFTGLTMHGNGTLTYRGATFTNEIGEARVTVDGGATIEARVMKGSEALITVTGTRISKDVCEPR